MLPLQIFPSSALGGGATGLVSVKPKGGYSSSVIARAVSWTPPSTSDGGYILLLNFNTAEAVALFAATPIPDTVALMADLTVVDGGQTIKSQTFAISLANQVSSADEAAPSPPLPTPSARRDQSLFRQAAS